MPLVCNVGALCRMVKIEHSVFALPFAYLGIFAANWHLRRETGSSKILILAGFGLMLFILTAFIVSPAVG